MKFDDGLDNLSNRLNGHLSARFPPHHWPEDAIPTGMKPNA